MKLNRIMTTAVLTGSLAAAMAVPAVAAGGRR